MAIMILVHGRLPRISLDYLVYNLSLCISTILPYALALARWVPFYLSFHVYILIILLLHCHWSLMLEIESTSH